MTPEKPDLLVLRDLLVLTALVVLVRIFRLLAGK